MQDSKVIKLTPEQRENMLHALGASHGTVGWRNYYLVGENDRTSWDDLCAKGLAEIETAALGTGDRYYRVTDAGIRALGYDPSIKDKPVKVTP